jgi:archaea-specific DNA-binding protein
MAYVFEAVAQLNSGAADVRIKARGKAIARAVDVAEVVRRHKLVDGRVQVVRVQIGTERLTNREGKDSNVSSIEIILAKEGGAPAPPGTEAKAPPTAPAAQSPTAPTGAGGG